MPELRAYAPFTSKDIDFLGDAETARECARLLGGRCYLPRVDDHTPNSARVIIHDRARTFEIDFMRVLHTLTNEEVRDFSIPIDVRSDEGELIQGAFAVMHPLHCMQSRVHAVLGRGRTDAISRRQLHASVICLRAFIVLELLGADLVRDTLNLYKRIYRYCSRDFHGRRAYQETGVDPFAAVTPHAKLPALFNERQYPQMVARLSARRT